jgi:hypothetical protein
MIAPFGAVRQKNPRTGRPGAWHCFRTENDRVPKALAAVRT